MVHSKASWEAATGQTIFIVQWEMWLTDVTAYEIMWYSMRQRTDRERKRDKWKGLTKVKEFTWGGREGIELTSTLVNLSDKGDPSGREDYCVKHFKAALNQTLQVLNNVLYINDF